MDNKNGFYHLFQTATDYYLYDINTDAILNLPVELYNSLRTGYLSDKWQLYVNELKKKGYLKNDRVEVIEHPVTEYLPFILDTKMCNLILQVTQNCNLRCEYCVYSGKYNQREHQNRKMTFDIAKKGIDFLLAHSKERDNIYIGFYGGEPMLEMDLIKKCVKYAKMVFEGKKIFFNYTTNGTLFTEEILDFIVENNFNIMVSVDGPKDIHDKFRKFARNGQGSYDILIHNLKWIKRKYPEYYKTNFTFNIVLAPGNDVERVLSFFHDCDLFDKSVCNLSFVVDRYVKEKVDSDTKAGADIEYGLFKLYLYLLGRLKDTNAYLLLTEITRMRNKRGKDKIARDKLPVKGHRGGPCIPGAFRLFMTVDGRFFPCERVSEKSCICEVGNVYEGYDLKKIENSINIGKVTEEQCKNCWVFSYCPLCLADADGLEQISSEIVMDSCHMAKEITEDMFQNYVTLIKYGYSFPRDVGGFPKYVEIMED